MNEQAARAVAALHGRGLSAALLTSPHNVCYASSYAAPIEAGPSPFASAPDMALLDASGHVTLIVPDLNARIAAADTV